jgi:thiosulfate/3-mercaptopyruvate sulfurtransferase
MEKRVARVQPEARYWTRRAFVGSAVGSLLLTPAIDAIARQIPGASPVANDTHSERLIDVATLADARSRSDVRVTALTPPEAFVAAHIPGARTIDWPALELSRTTEAAIRAWTQEMQPAMASLGSGSNFPVAIYDEGSLFACRLWWVLDYLGYDDKVILDGGLPAWTAAGLPTEAGEQDPFTTPGFEERSLRPDVLAPIADVVASIGDSGVVFVDARTPDEYAAGHIPGAVNVNYPLNAEPEPPRFWKSTEALTVLYADAGVTPDTRVIPYCTTGVRSAVTWFTLRMIGFPDVALFSGSWAEWSAHPELPVTTGPNP